MAYRPFTSRASQSSSDVATWISTKLSIQPRTSSRTARYGEIAAVTATTPLRASRLATNPIRRMLMSRSSFENVEALREVLAHLVAVEQLDPVARVAQLRRPRCSAIVLLPGARQAGEPEAEAGQPSMAAQVTGGPRER